MEIDGEFSEWGEESTIKKMLWYPAEDNRKSGLWTASPLPYDFEWCQRRKVLAVVEKQYREGVFHVIYGGEADISQGFL